MIKWHTLSSNRLSPKTIFEEKKARFHKTQGIGFCSDLRSSCRSGVIFSRYNYCLSFNVAQDGEGVKEQFGLKRQRFIKAISENEPTDYKNHQSQTGKKQKRLEGPQTAKNDNRGGQTDGDGQNVSIQGATKAGQQHSPGAGQSHQ